ncbi:ubiquitin-like protein 4A [Dysidea avara]|uniref:ubiquitin-like protein 4A n=1 Tax=Dysidea avara TaxID=196820 RepID=UPI0033186809
MLVTVKVLGGAEHTLDVAPDTPVIRVKQVLAETLDQPTASQRLIFKGKALSDDKALKFYNVVNGSKLNLVVKPVAATAATPATQAQQTTTTTTSAAQEPTRKGRFQTLLQQYLQQHYSQEDVTKLMVEVNKGIHDLVHNLNLDDVENIAVRNLEQQPSNK